MSTRSRSNSALAAAGVPAGGLPPPPYPAPAPQADSLTTLTQLVAGLVNAQVGLVARMDALLVRLANMLPPGGTRSYWDGGSAPPALSFADASAICVTWAPMGTTPTFTSDA